MNQSSKANNQLLMVLIYIITLENRMFKTSHSPLNANKDNKYYNQQLDYQPQSYHQSNYQYSKYSNNGNNNGYQNQRVQLNNNGGSSYGNNAPLCPLSPNVSKNPPTSPNAKIKMFSNTLNVNRKNSSQAGNHYQPVSQPINDPKQNNSSKFSRLGAKNLVLDLTQSLDLKCDQTFDQPMVNNYRKQPPQTCNININKQQNYPKRTSSKIPVLNFQTEVDDLKCDEVFLDVKMTDLQDQTSSKGNGNKFNNSSLLVNNGESNFTYTNNSSNSNKNNHAVGDKAPLTPGYDKRKANSILMRKNTDRQIYLTTTSSNPSPQNILPTQQKSRSFNNILSPYNPHKKSQQNITSQQQIIDNSKSNQSQIYEVSEMNSQEQNFDQLRKNLQRMSAVLEAYMKKCDDMKERQAVLEKENDQLRRCLYEDGGSKGVQLNQMHNVTSAGRYQGIK